MTLYLKYRPQKISDLDNKYARETLTKILKSGQLPHAYLFCGPKGTGKTSAARILAKVLNCEKVSLTDSKKAVVKNVEPCGECDQCVSISKGENLDVTELDAASNRGIDDIRSLRESIKLAPTKAKKRIYIIDEAHMLTVEASNAFLKTLEEPPPHVVFILATTNPEKLIPTIRSRVTTINFSKAVKEELVSALSKVAKGEGIKVDEKILTVIAEASDGSFRDAVKTFEELTVNGVIESYEAVKSYLEGNKPLDFELLFELFVKRDSKKIIEKIEESLNAGMAVKFITKGLLVKVQEKLLISVGVHKGNCEISSLELVDLAQILGKVSSEANNLIEELPLEVAVLEWGGEENKKTINSQDPEKKPSAELQVEVTKQQESSQVGVELRKNDPKKTRDEVHLKSTLDTTMVPEDGQSLSPELWSKVLYNIKPVNSSTEALLRAAKPISLTGETLILGVYYKFHKERLEERPHKELLHETVKNVLGKPLKIVCQLTDPPIVKSHTETPIPETIKPANITDSVLTEPKDVDIIKAAEDIFGR